MTPASSSSSTADAVLADAQHPWLGLWSYTEAQRDWFRGRNREAEDLLTLVRREPLTVLFGVSGLGKTSLVRAGLFPRLRERDAFPAWEMDGLPVYVRLDHGSTLPAGDQMLAALRQEAQARGADLPEPLAGESLWEYFHRRGPDGAGFEAWSAGNRPLVPVLVLDQFEELFTLGFGRLGAAGEGSGRRDGLHAFVADLACLVENRAPDGFRQRLEREPDLATRYSFDPAPVRIVLSLREDFVADLEGLRPLIRLVATSRLRLLPLSGEQAREVIEENGGDLIEPGVAGPLVRFVAARQRSRTSAPEGTGEAVTAPLVELRVDPALLSVMLRELNLRRIEGGQPRITESLLHAAERDILEQFFDRAFADLPGEAALRRFVEDCLITATGWRNSYALDDALNQEGIWPAGLDALVDRRILRYEDRLGHRHVELAHDVLAPLVRARRDDRQAREAREAAEAREREAEGKLAASRREIARVEFQFARLLLDLAERERGTAQLEFRAKAQARLAKSRKNDPANRAAAVLGLEQIRRAANRGALRNFSGGAVFSPCGSFLLSWSGTEARLWDAASGQPLAEPLRHEGSVVSAVFSPEGGRILTASWDKTARLWDAASGQPLAEPLRHENRVVSAVFSPEGGRILTASSDHTARLWDAASGQPLAEPLRHEGEVTSAVFSPEGGRILTASYNRTARLWDAASGQPLAEPLRHEGSVNSAVFSPEGGRILTASWDNTARLWDAASGQPLAEPLRHEGSVVSAVFSPEGGRILTASWDNTARLWDAASGQPLAEPLRHEGEVTSAVFSPEGGRILTASWDNTARLWDAASGQPLAEPLRHEGEVTSAVFSPEGGRILTASDDNTARLWDAASGQPLAEPLRHEGSVVSAVFSPEGGRILTASWDKTARLWDAASGQPLAEPLRHENRVVSAVFSPEGGRILTASYNRTARLWDAASGQPLAEPLRHEGSVNSAVFSPEGGRILTASWDKTARLWDAASGQPLAEPLRHENRVVSAVFSPEGGRILTASWDNTARLWDAASGQPLAEPLRHENRVVSAVFSPEGGRILTASYNRTARLWDAASGQPLAEPLRHEGSVNSAVFSPEGGRILTASWDKTARLWDAASGQPLAEPLRHENRVVSAVFSPEGGRILTASWDNTARLWDAASGQPLAEPLRHEGEVTSAVFSPEGGRILTASWDKTARLWDAATGELLAESSGCLNRLLEIMGGRRLNDRELLEPIPAKEIAAMRAEFDAATEFDRLLQWWWSDPFTRPIHPSSAITVPLFVRRRIGEVLDWRNDAVKVSALREARDAIPHHPLVSLCDALTEPATAPDPAGLRRHAVSRLLTEPHYLVPLEPLHPYGDTKANRQYELTYGLAVDCLLGARLLLNDRANEPRSTDPERIAQARQLLARARKLWPENEAIAKLAEAVGV